MDEMIFILVTKIDFEPQIFFGSLFGI